MSISKQFNKNIEFLSTQNIVGNSGGSVYIAGGLNIQDLNVSNTVTISNLTITNNLFTSNGNSFLSSQWITVPSGISYMSANVGIGTTSPGFNLDISGGSRITGSLTTGTLTTVIGASIPNLLNSNITTTNIIITGGSLNATFNSNTLGNLYTTGGNIGINVSAPSYSLDINGSTRINTNLNFYNKLLILHDESVNDNLTNATGFFGFGINSGTLRYQVNSTLDNHSFYCGSTGNFIVKDSSILLNYAISNNCAFIVQQMLYGYNTGPWLLTNNAGLQIGWNNYSGTGGIDFMTNLQGGGGPCYSFWFTSSTVTTPTRVSQIGTDGAYLSVSDYRLKDKVIKLNDSYNVDLLRPVEYIYNKTNQKQIGFIAHEVKEVFPFLVHGEKDCDQYQTLNYSGLIPVLVAEIQRLKESQEKLEIKQHTQELEITKLFNLIKNL